MSPTTSEPREPSLSEQLDLAEAEIKRLKGRGATAAAARVPGPLETAARAKMAPVKPLSLSPVHDQLLAIQDPLEKSRFRRLHREQLATERLLASARCRAMQAEIARARLGKKGGAR